MWYWFFMTKVYNLIFDTLRTKKLAKPLVWLGWQAFVYCIDMCCFLSFCASRTFLMPLSYFSLRILTWIHNLFWIRIVNGVHQSVLSLCRMECIRRPCSAVSAACCAVSRESRCTCISLSAFFPEDGIPEDSCSR